MDDAIALWDTGSEYCGISEDMAKRLHLRQIGVQPTRYGDGARIEEPVYLVEVTFQPSGRKAQCYAVQNGDDSEDFIVGMSLIRAGTFLLEPTEDGGVHFTFTI